VRIVRYVRQHHVGMIALFIALTGTAYAGTQLANQPGQLRVVKAKKKKPKLVPGPAGPQGPQGTPGPAGAARAYAHVFHGDLVAADTTGVSAMTRGCLANTTCTGPPPSGSESGYVYCFQLTFTPTSVQVTPDEGQTNGDAAATADSWPVAVPGQPVTISHSGCPPGYQSAEVSASTGGSATTVVTGFYVTFN
jgi:hypothetical protein